VIVAEIEGDADAACTALERVEGVDRVERHGDELTVLTPNAATVLSAVAVALETSSVNVRNLTMRTPTLDDVFLELTGAHLQKDEEEEQSDEESAA
jgi:ABC-2 type transport system ATP-binding protein